jgi:hypothetical protein
MTGETVQQLRKRFWDAVGSNAFCPSAESMLWRTTTTTTTPMSSPRPTTNADQQLRLQAKVQLWERLSYDLQVQLAVETPMVSGPSTEAVKRTET